MVGRFVRDEEVAGSNPAIPTDQAHRLICMGGRTCAGWRPSGLCLSAVLPIPPALDTPALIREAVVDGLHGSLRPLPWSQSRWDGTKVSVHPTSGGVIIGAAVYMVVAHLFPWRSRLARFLHTEEVTGSSPVGSTRSYEIHVGKILHMGRSTAGTYQRGQGSLTRPATACVARRAWVFTTSLWCGLPCDPSGGWTPLAGRGRSPAIDAPRSTQTVKGPVCKTVITGSTPVSASQVLHRGPWVHSSVDRASASGAEGRGFESH